jgi:hypothetical protein
MLVAAMEQQHGLARFAGHGRGRRPVAIEQFDAVMGSEGLMLGFAHYHFLML